MAHVIAIHGSRPGLGCSNLAADLSLCMAQRGKRVALVDTDVASAGLHTLFGVETEDDPQLLRGIWVLPPQSQKPRLTLMPMSFPPAPPPGGGVYLTPTSMSVATLLGRFQAISSENEFDQGMQTVTNRLQLSHWIFDTRSGGDEDSLLALMLTDVLLLVLYLDNFDAQKTAVMIEVAQRLGVPRVYLVPSLVPSGADSADLTTVLGDTLEPPILNSLPFAPELAAVASTSVFGVRYPNHPWTTAVQAIADQLLQIQAPSSDQASDQAGGGRDLTEVSPPSGIVGLLDLPDHQRKLIRFILRRGHASVHDLVEYLDDTPQAIDSSLTQLIQQQWIQTMDLAGTTVYKARLVNAKKR